jgi:beta-phosphoglucomutase-like phosphatase (HAD superfamily)
LVPDPAVLGFAPSVGWGCARFPDRTLACLFDLDGVLTATAHLHASAWKTMFDGYLRLRARRTGAPFVPFDVHADYDT